MQAQINLFRIRKGASSNDECLAETKAITPYMQLNKDFQNYPSMIRQDLDVIYRTTNQDDRIIFGHFLRKQSEQNVMSQRMNRQ